MLVPTTLAVLGILSSCPRVMTMQCWKSQIPPPLSTRPFVSTLLVFFLVPPKKEKKHDSAKLSRKKNSKTSEKRTPASFGAPQPLDKSPRYLDAGGSDWLRHSALGSPSGGNFFFLSVTPLPAPRRCHCHCLCPALPDLGRWMDDRTSQNSVRW